MWQEGGRGRLSDLQITHGQTQIGLIGERAHTCAPGRRHQELGANKDRNSSDALKPFSFPMSRLFECCGYSSLKGNRGESS